MKGLGQRALNRVRRALGRGQRGQSYVEFILVLPLLLLLVAGSVSFGHYLYAQLAVEAACWSGARHAVATLSQERGLQQGYDAVRYTLQGFGVDPAKSRANIRVWGSWGRGRQLSTTVCVDIEPPPIPFAEMFVEKEMCATQTMAVYKWKSEWE